MIVHIFILWEFLSIIFNVPEYLLPRPSLVLIALFQSFPTYLPHFFVTFTEAILGFFLALIIGVFFVGLFELSKIIKQGIYPYIIVVRIAPVIALAPFLVLWFGNGMISKILTATIMSVFFVVVNLTKGFSEVESQSLDLMKSLSASKWQILRHVIFPNSLPEILTGVRVAVGMCWGTLVAAEFLAGTTGIGFVENVAKKYFQYEVIWITIFVMGMLGLLFDVALRKIIDKTIPWHGKG